MKDILIAARKIIEKEENWLSVRGTWPRDFSKRTLQEAVVMCSYDFRNNRTIFSFLERFTDGKTLLQFNDEMEHKDVLNVLDQAIEYLEKQDKS